MLLTGCGGEPGPAALVLNATTTVVAEGVQSAIRATVCDRTGRPLADIAVTMNAEGGTVEPSVVHTDATGVVTATFKAGTAPGHAIIRANVGDLKTTSTLEVRAPATADSVTIELDVNAVCLTPGQRTQVFARVRDATSQPVAGEPVTLLGTLGDLTPPSAITDKDGRVKAIFVAGPDGGNGRIVVLATHTSSTTAIIIVAPEHPPTVTTSNTPGPRE
jgi:adhesin/invasin